MNELNRKRNSDYFICIPDQEKLIFPSNFRKRSVSTQRKDINIKLPAIKNLENESNSINFNSSLIIYHAGKLPNITKKKNTLLTIAHKRHKSDMSSEANL